MTQQEIKAALEDLHYRTGRQIDRGETPLMVSTIKTIIEVLGGALWNFDMTTAPKEDHCVFLILIKRTAEMEVIMQVEVFEGQIYPCHLYNNIDWDDRIENATAWRPLPSLPDMEK